MFKCVVFLLPLVMFYFKAFKCTKGRTPLKKIVSEHSCISSLYLVILFPVVPYQRRCCLFLTHPFMVLCPIIGHCDICYWVFAFVCATQLSDDVIAHSRAGLAPFSFALWLPTADSSHQHLWCVMAGAQTRPPGLCEEQSRRCAHTSDRCTRCHYPPLIIILPVLVILRASLAFYPAWLHNSCSLTRFLYLS